MKSIRPAVDVARGATYLIANNIVTTVVSVAAFAIIARLISREEMGGLAVLLLIAAGMQFLAGLGVGSTATRFVASFEAAGEYEKMRRAGYECLVLNGLCVLVLCVGIFFSADMLASFLFGSISRANLLRFLTLEIGAVGVSQSLGGILVGLRRFKEISLTQMATFVVRQALVVMFLEFGWGLSGILIGWGIGDSLTSIFYVFYTRKFLGPPALGFGFAKLLRFSAPLFLGEGTSYVWGWFDRALLLPFVSLAQLGSYNVSVTAFGILNSLPGAISGTLFPFYSQLYHDESKESQMVGLEKAVKTASRYVSFFTIPLSVGLAVTALPAATLLAGNNYADSAYPLAILSISLAVACQAKALGPIFIVIGKTVTSAVVTIASVLIPVIVGAVLIPYLGILGVSLARGSSLIISMILSILILRMILKIRFDMKAYSYAWIASLVMAGAVLAAQSLFYSKYLLPVYILLGGTVFMLAIRSLHAISREDLELASDFLTPRLRFIARWLGRFLGVQGSVAK